MNKKEYNKLWRQKNPDKIKESAKKYRERNKDKLKKAQTLYREKINYHKNWHLKNRYGINLEVYKELLIKQNGVCAICKNPETSETNRGTLRQLAVDHCHTTGKVRGLLCRNCNVSLGMLKENKETILNMLEYLDYGR